MSRKLAKILSICALVVLLPLVILGVALSVAGNKGVTLSIFEGGNSVVEGTSSKIAIFVDNQDKGNKVTVKQGTEVTVTWEGTGFDFDGWYKGTESEAQGATAVSTNRSYKFTLNQNMTLTAIKTYVSYSMNVKFHANSSKTSTIAYYRQTADRDAGFGEYRFSRTGYTFKGLKYNGKTYIVNGTDFICGGSSLSRELLASEDHKIDVVAYWECNYSNINVILNTKTDMKGVYSVYGKNNGIETNYHEKPYFCFYLDDIDDSQLSDEDKERYRADLTDLNANVYDKFFDGNTELYAKKDDGEVRVAIDWAKVRVRVGDTVDEVYDINFTGYTSLRELMTIVEEARQNKKLQNSKLQEADKLTILFAFKTVA